MKPLNERLCLSDKFEIFWESTRSINLIMENGKISNSTVSHSSGVGAQQKKTHYSYTEHLLTSPSGDLIAKFNNKLLNLSTKFKPHTLLRSILSLDHKLELLSQVFEATKKISPHLTRVRISCDETTREISSLNSEGTYHHDFQPWIQININVQAQKGDRQINSFNSTGSSFLSAKLSYDPVVSLGQKAAQNALVMLNAGPPPTGKMDIVLAAGDGGLWLHEAVGHGLEADFIINKESYFTNRLGQMVASPLCTIIDNPLLDDAPGTLKYDDEGILGKPTILINKGILTGFLTDSNTACELGTQPSGNGRRQGYRHLTLPRMTNLCLAPGSSSKREILSSVTKGIYVTKLSSGEVNVGTGDFIFTVLEGILIENGRLTTPVSGVTLMGNALKLIKKISMVGNDFTLSTTRWTCLKKGQCIPVGIGTPTIKLDNISLGSQ